MGFRAILLFFTLGSIFVCQAQSFQLDSTFQPFFDIRNQNGAQINDIHESKQNGKIYLAGNFKNFDAQSNYDGLVCYLKNGQLCNNFSALGSGNISSISKINDTTFYIARSGIGGFIDSTGNSLRFSSWRMNALKSVRCATGVPYFFTDGSSLFANTSDNSGDPCDIGFPDSTNPGSHIMKLTPEGLWDSSFVVKSNSAPIGFVRYDSNRLLIYGNPRIFKTYEGVQIDGMCRIFLDGTLDTSFHSPLLDTSAGSLLFPPQVQGNGSFFLMGTFLLKDKVTYHSLVKVNSNGTLDTNFMNFFGAADSTRPEGYITTIAPTPDKGYLVGGRFTHYQGLQRPSIAKIDSNGKAQPFMFSTGGPDSADFFGAVDHPTVKIILASQFGGYYVGGTFLSWDDKPSQPIVRLTGLDSADLVDTNTSVHEIKSIENQVNIYPNPANESVTIQAAEQAEIVEIQLFSLHGKTVPIDVLKATNSLVSIQLSTLKSGIYIIQVKLHNGLTLRKKLVKH